MEILKAFKEKFKHGEIHPCYIFEHWRPVIFASSDAGYENYQSTFGLKSSFRNSATDLVERTCPSQYHNNIIIDGWERFRHPKCSPLIVRNDRLWYYSALYTNAYNYAIGSSIMFHKPPKNCYKERYEKLVDVADEIRIVWSLMRQPETFECYNI